MNLFAVIALVVAAFARPAPQESLAATGRPLEVWPGRVEWKDTGNQLALGGKSALAAAVLASEPGSVITVHGAHGGLSVAYGNASGKDAAIRTLPFDFDLVAGDDGYSVRSWILGESGGGVAFFGIDGAVMKGRGVQRVAMVAQYTEVGGVSVTNCLWESDAQTQFLLRFHGSAGELEGVDLARFPRAVAGVVIRGNTALGPCQEHFGYFDNIRNGAVLLDNYAAGMRRTMFQLDCRYWPHDRPSSGDIYIAGNVAERCGQDGAWAFTIAGHVGGTVYINKRPNGVVDPNQVIDCVGGGAGLAFLDQKQYQVKNPQLSGSNQLPIIGVGFVIGAEFQGGKVTKRGFALQRLEVYYPGAECSAIDTTAYSFGAVKELVISSDPRGPAAISTNKVSIDLAHNGQTNGSIELWGRQSPATWPFVNTTGGAEWREGSKIGIDPTVYWVQEP